MAVLVGAVLLLRTPPDDQATPTTKPTVAPQTTVKAYAREGVIVPGPEGRPSPPPGVHVVPGPQRLQLLWGPRYYPSGQPENAAGYEVQWGRMGTMEFTRLVAVPAVQLDALADNTSYDIEIRTVDAFGQRSQPLKTSATPAATTDDPVWSFNDRFTSRVVPDPVNWRFASTGGCGKATHGEGEDGVHLVISGNCGNDPVALRARAPFTLRDTPVNGEFGRFVVETDHPSLGGDLLLDLVPGPADLIDGSPNGSPAPGPAGVAQDDPSLPPGAIRVRISAADDRTNVQVLVAPGTPRVASAVSAGTAPPPEIGFSVRWEVVLGAGGVTVLRDGVVVGGGNVVPAWRVATALVGFVGATNGIYAGVNLIGFVGAPTTVPVLVVPPEMNSGPVVVAPDAPFSTSVNGARVAGAQAAQVRVVLVPQNPPGEAVNDAFTIEVGGGTFPARPAVPGQPLARGVRYPIVADIPVNSLVLASDGKTLPLQVRGPQHTGQASTRVIYATVELTAPNGAVSPAAGSGIDQPLPRPKPALAKPSAKFFDAAGNPVAEGADVQRGRMVLEIGTDGRAGQQVAGRLAGMAGVEVRLDGQRVAGIPTTTDGPGTGGVWRLALPTGNLTPGRHVVEVKALGVDATTAPTFVYASFQLAR